MKFTNKNLLAILLSAAISEISPAFGHYSLTASYFEPSYK